MTKKLEELLNLPESKEIIDKDREKAKEQAVTDQKEDFREIAELDKIQAALPQVKGLGEMADKELNEPVSNEESAHSTSNLGGKIL